LLTHGISKTGKKTPVPVATLNFNSQQTLPLRHSEAYVQLTNAVKRDPFTDCLISFLVICQLSFSLIVNALFIEFAEMLYPQVKNILPKAANTIRAYVIHTYEKRKEKLKGEIARCQSMVHFSFDLWTSPNHLALLGIVAHYIDEYGQNQSVS
jgi:hypothetical protein